MSLMQPCDSSGAAPPALRPCWDSSGPASPVAESGSSRRACPGPGSPESGRARLRPCLQRRHTRPVPAGSSSSPTRSVKFSFLNPARRHVPRLGFAEVIPTPTQAHTAASRADAAPGRACPPRVAVTDSPVSKEAAVSPEVSRSSVSQGHRSLPRSTPAVRGCVRASPGRAWAPPPLCCPSVLPCFSGSAKGLFF